MDALLVIIAVAISSLWVYLVRLSYTDAGHIRSDDVWEIAIIFMWRGGLLVGLPIIILKVVQAVGG